MTIKQDGAIFRSTHLGKSPTSAPITLQVNIVFLRHFVLLTCCCGRVGIAAAYNSHVQYFDGEDRRDKYDDFYIQLVRVKDIAALPFADTAQKLLVTYIREDLGQPRAANWYEGHWTGTYGRYSLAHAGYTGSNNNMGLTGGRLTGVT